jgi:hypothetical protein
VILSPFVKGVLPVSASLPPPPVARVRRRWPLWAAVLLFLAAAVSVPMARHFRKQAEPRFQQVSEVADRIHQKIPELHIIAATADGNPDKGGVYICETPRSWVELQRLPRNPESIDRWQGVVYAFISPANVDTNVIGWGENDLTVGHVLFFGDARLIARIRAALTPG